MKRWWPTRREVAVALSVIGKGDEATKLLEALAKDKDSIVREAAIGSIGELKDPDLIKPAENALDDSVPEVAFAAARALFELKQPHKVSRSLSKWWRGKPRQNPASCGQSRAP